MAKNDGLPNSICVKCYCQVDTSVEFKKLCEESFQFVTRQLALHSQRLKRKQQMIGNTSVETNHNGLTNGTTDSSDHNSSSEPPVLVAETVSPSKRSSPRKNLNSSTETRNQQNESDNMGNIQISSTAGNVQAWCDDSERIQIEIDTSIVKMEPMDYDENGYDYNVHSNDETVEDNNFIENGSASENNIEVDDEHDKEPASDPLNSSSNLDRSCKCRSCDMTFSSRREMGFHITTTHRRCADCGKYFFSNRHKDGHNCTAKAGDKKGFQKKQFCRLCKKTVKHMKAHRNSLMHRVAKEKLNKKIDVIEEPEPVKEEVKVNGSVEIETSRKSNQPTYETGNLSDEKITCHLCNLVCSNQRGFKTHMTCMHRDHKIVYYCTQCQKRVFHSKIACEKHMINKHGQILTDSIQFQFKPVSEVENLRYKNESDEENQEVVRKRRSAIVNKFECSYCAIKYLSFSECLDHLFSAHKSTNAQKINILREVMDSNTKVERKEKKYFKTSTPVTVDKPKPISVHEDDKSDFEKDSTPYKFPKKIRLKKGYKLNHPPFIQKMPVISNNFDVVAYGENEKEYTCRGCKTVYNRYISAYNHYYTITRKPAEEMKPSESLSSKPYGCKICTLKFASRSQAVSHRYKAHKLFYKQLRAAKKKKSGRTEILTNT